MEKDSHAGTYGWVGIVAGVVAWDILAPETLSGAVDRALESKRGYLAIGAITLTAAHLLNVIPDPIDPFKLIPNVARGRAEHNNT